MDEGKLVADFIAKNIDGIWGIAKKVFGTVDEILKVKLKSAYTNYLTNTREKYSKSKSFFIRNQSVDLYSYYVPTGIKCGAENIPIPSFKNCLEFSNRIVVTGTGGSGKTVLIKHLFLDCIKNKRYAPILIELRDLNNENKNLDGFIESTLETYGFNISGDFISRAKKEGHFCFFLDGFDEVDYTLRKKLLKQIKSLSNKYSKCPIFISTRPDNAINGIDDFSIFGILSLNLNSAISLIQKLPFDKTIKEKFTDDLSDGLFEQHESFLSNPLLLSIMLLTYSENAEIPSKLSIFYNQAYEALFQRHDAYKGGYSRNRLTDLDIQDFSRVFSLFALQTYEKRLFRMPRTDCLRYIEKSRDNLHKEFSAEDYLADLLSAACLLLEDGLEISFSHRSFQEYFVALHISSASPEIQDKLINRYWKNWTSDRVIYLLLEINPELIERLLLVPQLGIMFSQLGVRRNVGITHAAKFFKTVYQSLNIEQNRLSATLRVGNENLDNLVHLAVNHCQTYISPDEDHFKRYHSQMYSKYGKKTKNIRYITDKWTYRTPILVEMLNSKGAFSIAHLQAAFEAFKILKVKHENRSQSIDELLGI